MIARGRPTCRDTLLAYFDAVMNISRLGIVIKMIFIYIILSYASVYETVVRTYVLRLAVAEPAA
jgi:hypothetical protein